MVGAHHKTGTVLLGQLFFDLAKLRPNATFHKPSWTHCPLDALPPLLSPPPAPPLTTAAIDGLMPWPLPPPPSVAAAVPRLVCLDEHAKSAPPRLVEGSGATAAAAAASGTDGGMRFVHVVRDPLEVCVSSYLYSLTSTEGWLHLARSELGGLSWQQHLHQLDPKAGLLADCGRSLKELRQTAALYAATARRRDTLTLRLEELERSFDATIARLYFFVGAPADGGGGGDGSGGGSGGGGDGRSGSGAGGGDGADARRAAVALRLLRLAQKHDLSRLPRTELPAHVQAHVTNTSSKSALRAILLDPAASHGVGKELATLRAQLDYPAGPPPLPGPLAVALTGRWRLATTWA